MKQTQTQQIKAREKYKTLVVNEVLNVSLTSGSQNMSLKFYEKKKQKNTK